MIEQGDIRWIEEPGSRPRPGLVLTRGSALEVLMSVTIAPLTRTRRGIPTEVPIGADDGVQIDCVASFDNVRTVHRSHITDSAGRLAPGRWWEVCEALRAATGC